MAQEKMLPSSRNRTNILWSSSPSPSQHTDRVNLAHMSDTHCYITLELRLKRLVLSVYLTVDTCQKQKHLAYDVRRRNTVYSEYLDATSRIKNTHVHNDNNNNNKTPIGTIDHLPMRLQAIVKLLQTI